MQLKFPKPVKQLKARKHIKARRRRKTYVDKNGHEFLYGTLAHSLRRLELYKRAGGQAFLVTPGIAIVDRWAKCEGCGTPIGWENFGPLAGEWSHEGVRHCDCLKCGRYLCHACHNKRHHGRLGSRP